MLETLLYGFLFFAIPLFFTVLWGISISRYRSAKKQNRKEPGTVPAEEIKKRKIRLIVLSIITGALLAVVIGFWRFSFWPLPLCEASGDVVLFFGPAPTRRKEICMKARTYTIVLCSVIGVCLALTIAHFIYAIYAYRHCSIIYFIGKELWG